MLTRSRGGDLLDQAGETHHLIAACLTHHRTAHSRGYEVGLMLEGYVNQDSASAKIYYNGPDPYLSQTYPDPRST